MHPGPGFLVAVVHLVIYFARAALAFSAGIECRHCTYHSHVCYHMVLIFILSVVKCLGCYGGDSNYVDVCLQLRPCSPYERQYGVMCGMLISPSNPQGCPTVILSHKRAHSGFKTCDEPKT